ncbi:MAG: TetR/AcrR family transcriptional regulator [Elusimicrobiota bacterium]
MNIKEKIIREAKEVFAQKGYYGANMEEIAGKAKVAKGTLYNYFTNKQELYVTVILDLLSIIDRWINNAKNSDKEFWEKIDYLSRKVLKYFSQNKKVFAIIRRETPVNTVMRKKEDEKIVNLMKSRVKKLAAIFKEHRSEGVISDKYTDQEGAFLCLGVVESMVRRSLEGWERDPDKNADLVIRFLKDGLGKK